MARAGGVRSPASPSLSVDTKRCRARPAQSAGSPKPCRPIIWDSGGMRSLQRLFSRWICGLLLRMLSGDKKMWARAVRAETDRIPNDGIALLFALDALRGFALVVLSDGFFAAASLVGRALSRIGSRIADMTDRRPGAANAGLIGNMCAIGAVCCGLAYLYAAGAPIQMLAINAGTLTAGLAAVAIWTRLPAVPANAGAIAIVLMSCALLATALGGSEVDGASRWIALDALAVQPSLILLPAIVLTFAVDRGPTATAGILIAALSMALQPDRAMAGALMCGLAALAIACRDRFTLIALTASVAAFVVTMILPDRLAAVPYVDQILFAAFDLHVVAGFAVAAGAMLLLMPALLGLSFGSRNRGGHMAFGAVWLSVIAAAALGNYPTPVVGYGGSAILGYLFSLAVLLRCEKPPVAARPAAESLATFQARDPRSRFSSRQLA